MSEFDKKEKTKAERLIEPYLKKDPTRADIIQKICNIIDHTFLQRGFNPGTHTVAVLDLLEQEGYELVKKKKK